MDTRHWLLSSSLKLPREHSHFSLLYHLCFQNKHFGLDVSKLMCSFGLRAFYWSQRRENLYISRNDNSKLKSLALCQIHVFETRKVGWLERMPLLNLESGAAGRLGASGCSASETMRNPHGVYSHWVHLHAAHFSAMPPRPRWQSPCCSGWCNSSGIMRGITSLQPMAAGQVYDRGKGCIWEPLTWFHVSCPQQHFISYSPGWSLPTLTTPTTEVDGEKWMSNIMWKINIDHLMVL